MTPDPVYALTLHQPWATLILEYGKDIENRTWEPPATLKPGDRLWIHAGQTWDTEGAEWARGLVDFPSDLPKGCLLGHVRFDGCVRNSDSPWFHGPWGWKFSDPVVIPEPVPMAGNRKLWRPYPISTASFMSDTGSLIQQFLDAIALVWGDDIRSKMADKVTLEVKDKHPYLASVVMGFKGRADGRTLYRVGPVTLRVNPRIFTEGHAKVEGILKHEAIHLGHGNHDSEFRSVAHEVGAPLTESAAEGKKPALEVKDGSRYRVFREFDSYDDAVSWYRSNKNDPELKGKKVRVTASTTESLSLATPKKDLGETTVTEYGVTFKTGQSVTFYFAHNTEKSKNMGKTFQQDIEPAGKYMIAVAEDAVAAPGWVLGTVTFDRPLVVKFHDTDDTSYDEGSWKARLTKAFGKKGKSLSQALLSAGYDAIVTVRNGDTAEIIDLAPDRRKTADAASTTDLPLDHVLGSLLCSLRALSIHVQQYHWTVSGSTFSTDHELLNDAYTLAITSLDAIAERMMSLKMQVPSPATQMQFAETYAAIASMEDAAYAVHMILPTFAYANAHDDITVGTQNLLGGIADEFEKLHYFLYQRIS